MLRWRASPVLGEAFVSRPRVAGEGKATMETRTIALACAVGMSAIGIAGDYFLKRASVRAQPLLSADFLLGLALYASTAFAWVVLMRHLPLATIGVVYSVCMILMLTAMGVAFFGEVPSGREVIGIGLAIAALFLLARFG